MHEFETFVYLDMEKTGSTFISRMLNDFSKETPQMQAHHKPVDADFDPKKFYFISVRDPLDSYLSLYSFGCQKQGKVYAHFRKRGFGDMYDGTAEGFNAWLRLMLKANNVLPLGDRYHKVADGRLAGLLGFQSYRYLRLAIPDAENLLADCRSEDDIRAVFKANKLPKFTVRHETFVEDLCRLLSGPLAYAMEDVDAALEHVRTAEPMNASERVDKGEEKFRVMKRLRTRLKEREWLMAEVFGY